MLPKCNIIYFDPRFTRQISRGQETMPGKTEDTRLRAYPITPIHHHIYLFIHSFYFIKTSCILYHYHYYFLIIPIILMLFLFFKCVLRGFDYIIKYSTYCFCNEQNILLFKFVENFYMNFLGHVFITGQVYKQTLWPYRNNNFNAVEISYEH